MLLPVISAKTGLPAKPNLPTWANKTGVKVSLVPTPPNHNQHLIGGVIMASSSVSKLFDGCPLREIEHRALYLQNNIYEEVSNAGGGIKAIGNILFSSVTAGRNIQGITNDDIQGLALALESLGRYVEGLSTKIEDESSDILHRLKELPGMPEGES